MAWSSTIFLNQYRADAGPCTDWEHATNFSNPWTNSQFYWVAEGINDYTILWNTACAVRLLITKVESLSGGGVNMGSILTAMQSASFEELNSFMGITQAYKVAVWDAPFNEEFYAALARGFKTWGT